MNNIEGYAMIKYYQINNWFAEK